MAGQTRSSGTDRPLESAAAPPPISGTRIDPPPPDVPNLVRRLDRSAVGAVAYRATRRYAHANTGLLSAGTAYYMFLALLSLLAFAYGLIALLGADRLSEALTDSLRDALPGLVGENGVDPQQLRATGRASSIVGLLLMLYSGLGAVNAAGSAMHLLFGAPPDPRKFVAAKLRHLAILLVIAPLVLLSFASVGATSNLGSRALNAIGLGEGLAATLLEPAGWVVGFTVDLLIVWLLLGNLGGIRPHPKPRVIASAFGAGAMALVKALLGAIISWSLDKPQYGAFAAPLALLFVLSLLANVLYAAGALAAGISDRDVPVDQLAPAPAEAGTGSG